MSSSGLLLPCFAVWLDSASDPTIKCVVARLSWKVMEIRRVGGSGAGHVRRHFTLLSYAQVHLLLPRRVTTETRNRALKKQAFLLSISNPALYPLTSLAEGLLSGPPVFEGWLPSDLRHGAFVAGLPLRPVGTAAQKMLTIKKGKVSVLSYWELISLSKSSRRRSTVVLVPSNDNGTAVGENVAGIF